MPEDSVMNDTARLDVPRGVVRIQALGYRSLRYVDQRLLPFEILVGPNASGKSSFLDVVGFLGDLLQTDLDTAVRGDLRLDIPHRAPDPRQLTWMRRGDRFELAVELAIPPGLQQKKDIEYQRIRYEIAVGTGDSPGIETENVWLVSSSGDGVRSARQIELFPAPPTPPPHIVRRPGKRKPTGWKKVISRGEAGKAYFIAETTGWNAPFALSSQKAALAILPEDRDRFPVALWLRDVLREGVRRLMLSSEAMRRPAPPTRKAGYLPDGSNLPYVVDRLERSEPERFARWVEHLREALPGVENITTDERPEDRHRYLVIRYRNGLEAPSWLVSDGTLRMLALTLLAYTPDASDGIYLVEEPENGIHPRAVETVFQSLSSTYEAQVLLATHSPVILGMADLDTILCFATDEEGATDVVAGNEHPRLRSWRGALDLASLFAGGVLG